MANTDFTSSSHAFELILNDHDDLEQTFKDTATGYVYESLLVCRFDDAVSAELCASFVVVNNTVYMTSS